MHSRKREPRTILEILGDVIKAVAIVAIACVGVPVVLAVISLIFRN